MTEVEVSWLGPWSEHCAVLMEAFGLAGDRFLTKVGKEGMIFQFFDPEDALMARLLVGS
jgi:hypothetical protein